MPNKPLSDQIREAIKASDLSRYAICKAIGWDQGAMSHFLSGRRGMSLETLDRLADLLGWRLATGPEESEK